MRRLQELYLDIFKLVYPNLHTHFVSYLLYLSILSAVTYFIWRMIQKRGHKGLMMDKLVLLFWYSGLFFFVGYIAWFVMIYFETYKLFK